MASDDISARQKEEYKVLQTLRSIALDYPEVLKEFVHTWCPKCGVALNQVMLFECPVESCTSCQGIFLDKGELDLIIERATARESHFSRLWKALARRLKEKGQSQAES